MIRRPFYKTLSSLTIVLVAILLQGWFSGDTERAVILISIDGLHPDYLDTLYTPNLLEIAAKGVHPAYMEPVFPTKTFPNHYSLITGLYPANHGIVNNSMYDPDLGRFFRLSDREAISDQRWWKGEPLWNTIQKQNRTSATYFWPGSEAPIQGMRPTYWMKYDASLPHRARIDSAMAAITRSPRPALVTIYFSAVDSRGHEFGPDAPETREALQEIDGQIGNLIARLREEGLEDEVNIVVVGDHGMAATSSEEVMLVDDYIDLEEVYITDLGPIGLINVKDSARLESLLADLNKMPHVRWFKRGHLPAELHYSGSTRISDLVGIADDGWQMASKSRFESNPDFYSGGNHGYEPRLQSMHTVFIARGPQFKQGLKSHGFSLIHVYELLCAVLGIEPAENDGNLDEVVHFLQTETG
ncbi:MAG: ectonucleotide pyrophosphatase/phosphodiesterase [Bacteroidota bacterium]|nr:ectonucleotide pyrophosphatase/phosphodiesterase [Bacteroidota bacterium]